MLLTFWTWYMSLSKIIKLSQTVWELWPAQDFGIRGDKYIMKVRKWEYSWTRHAYWSLSMLYQILSKYFKQHTQEFSLEIHSGEVTRKQPQQRLSLLHVTHLLVVTNASTKYYQNMSKGIKVMECTRFWLQGRYLHNEEESESCLSCTWHAYWSSSSSLPNIIILSQTVWELWPAQDFSFRGDNYIMKKVRVVSLAHDTPTGPPLRFYKTLSKYV